MADKSTTGFDLVCLDVLRSIGNAEALLLRRVAETAYLLDQSYEPVGGPIASRLETRLKEILSGDDFGGLGRGRAFAQGLYEVLDKQFDLPVLRLFGGLTDFAERSSFAILTLEKLGVLESSTYWRDGRLKRRQTVSIVDRNFYRTLREQRGLKQIDEEEERFRVSIGETLALSVFGEQFVQRCIKISSSQS